MLMTANETIQVLLIDDHDLVRTGLRMLLESWPHFQLAGEAGKRQEALALAASVPADVILLDLDLAGSSSLEFLPELMATARSAGGEARVLVLTGVRDPEQHRQAVRMGARGVVMKDQAAGVLNKAIEKVHAGELWLDRAMVASVFDEILHQREASPVDSEAARIATLSERELEVIARLCEGRSNKEIAGSLSITENTVRHHLGNIFEKLGVESRLDLVIYAFRHDLASPK